ncbi:probable aminopeptidase NPEPL1 [Bradysia coprophila]|uniref:probable aminopeptidase NPEPL1 n=1 Tax=Bradysia coprophila TaxID=38358 RepID=UPI00187D8270|nr:probable aminopeptidase NPEPL1 [Bradysia coprophila]XP_037026093.1 probable aminopeptidase NPEPL1 [Bradysia coprophila]
MVTKVKFNKTLTKTDPQQHPVLIIGQLRHLSILQFDHVRCKLEPRVTEETFKSALTCLHPSPTDYCPLFLDVATIAALPTKTSRHNTPSRAHSVTALVKTHAMTVTESIVIVCNKSDLYASACAAVRAFPLFSLKTVTADISSTVNIEFILIENDSVSDYQLTDNDIECLENAEHAIRLTAKIVDAPCSHMDVSHFINEIQKIGNLLGISPLIISGEELKERGFGGIYGVGKAAVVPPALVVLSYEPAAATDTIALVGKGIVYDTGGLSIKGKTAMPGMKRDCGGAAAILGAFYAFVKSGFNQNLHAVFCLAENSVAGNATRPDDIHTLYSGKTVEINNTDAEGRLVLADGVAYARKDLKANIIVDMATLTGAQGIATGKYHGAVLTNDEEWEIRSVEAGRASGDLLAPIVYCPELHFSEYTSAVADMKNSVSDRSNALSSCAGLFIGSHIGFDFPGIWIHFDMAYPVHCGERATGYGVSLLCTLFGNETQCDLLRSIAPKKCEPPVKKICRG